MLADPDRTDAEAAAGGDRAAFARLAERHYDRIHAMAWRWTGSRAGAEDVAQETMIKVAKAIRGFRGEARLSTWIAAIACRCALDHLRAARKVIAFPGETLDALRAAPAPAQAGPDPAEKAGLWRAVRSLPARQRDAMLLIYAEGMSHAATPMAIAPSS